MPPLSFSSAGVPCSATLPPCKTTIFSAPSTVRMRCAMIRTVFSLTSADSADCTSVSFSASSEAVASSMITMGASFRIARAMEMRCRSPPDSIEPFSPITVSYPFGSLSTNPSHCAARAACKTSSSEAPCLPMRMFSFTVLLNSVTS